MAEKKFLIHEMAELAGTTVRTIRYYTDEGLLPQPDLESKYAYYSNVHLNRLLLIKDLKDQFLPLSEIRRLLNTIMDADVEKLVNDRHLRKSPDRIYSQNYIRFNQAELDKSSALKYIDELMGRQAGGTPAGGARLPQKNYYKVEDKKNNYMMANPAPANPAVKRESWRKIRISDDIELSLREPVDQDLERRIEQVIAYVLKLTQKY